MMEAIFGTLPEGDVGEPPDDFVADPAELAKIENALAAIGAIAKIGGNLVPPGAFPDENYSEADAAALSEFDIMSWL